MSIVNNMSTEVVGSATLITTTANAELLPQGKRYVNLVFQADQVCAVLVNGSASAIYLRAGQVLNVSVCTSLKVTTSSITCNWYATVM